MSEANVEVVQRFVERWNATGEPHWEEIDPHAVFVIDPGSCAERTPSRQRG
jgi:hypothetical protein